VRAGEAAVDEVMVDEPLAASADEVLGEVDEAAAAAETAFTLLFTKRCSLASNVMVEPLGCPENRAAAFVESRVRVLRAGTVVELACETKVCAGTSFTTFHLAPGEVSWTPPEEVRGVMCARFNGVLLPLSNG
jgi:hypothetical protein